MRRALGEPKNRETAWKQCAACQELMPVFMAELAAGQAAARARLQKNPADEEALFFLGKLDLNYVWLQLGTVGRKTGWSEYWEARKSLDAVLKQNPGHVRAQVARAWIDYIVDTKLPRGTRWMLGGGDRKKGLLTVQQAARSAADPFVQAEAMFGLWDMQVRERNMADAVVTARALARRFPRQPGAGEVPGESRLARELHQRRRPVDPVHELAVRQRHEQRQHGAQMDDEQRRHHRLIPQHQQQPARSGSSAAAAR